MYVKEPRDQADHEAPLYQQAEMNHAGIGFPVKDWFPNSRDVGREPVLNV